MKGDQGIQSTWCTRLLVTVIALQCVFIALLMYYERESFKRDNSLMGKSEYMIEELFPGLSQDLMIVSRKATDISKEVKGLQQQVAQVDDHLGAVERDVHKVGSQVGALDTTMRDFISDTSGFLKGSSLNLYLLVISLGLLGASIILFGKSRAVGNNSLQASEPIGLEASPLDTMIHRLDTLEALLKRMQTTDRTGPEPGPELRKLMEQTEQLIREARLEFVLLSSCGRSSDGDTEERPPETLH